MRLPNPMMIAAAVITFLLVCVSSLNAQTDTTVRVDKVHLRNGSILEGKVKVVKTDIVEFVENETDLTYELRKSEIRVIILGSGKSISFADEPDPKTSPAPSQPLQPVIIEKEGGSNTGLVILATIGALLMFLLILGAASSP